MKKEKKKKEKQLDFGLKSNPKNIYYKYKDQYELWLAGLETKKYFKDPLLWFTIVISSSLLFTQVYTIRNNIIPSKIPVLNYFIYPGNRLVSTNFIYLFSILGGLILIVGVLLSRNFYHKERELSKILLIVTLLTNMSLCLIFLRLFVIF